MVLNKIGLTGAAGMLGHHLRTALEERGIQVVALSRKSEPVKKIIGWNLKDWQSLEYLDSIFEGVQAVVHAGAMLPDKSKLSSEDLMFNINVRSCINLGLWAIKRQVPIVFVSSSCVYRYPEKINLEESAELGWNELGGFYGFSKLQAEDALMRLCSNGLRLAIIRPSAIYGLGLPENKLVSSFLHMARAGKIISLTQPVNDRINFVHATDVSLAILAILKMGAWDIFNIASDYLLSVKGLAEACVSVVGNGDVSVDKEHPLERAPINRFGLNTERAKSCLGWQPSISIKQGLEMILKEDVY